MNKYLIGFTSGVAVTLLVAKYKEEIIAFGDSLACECGDDERCEFCCKKKQEC
ncbi:hypothetical protein MZM54_03325 [[Brevibacterium] frigoritolerans]|nr:hypothetical protein [Peribacillus frigoritolerans]